MSEDSEEKPKVLIVGRVGAETVRSMTAKLTEKGFHVYGEDEAEELVGKKILMVDENSDLARLARQTMLKEIEPKVIKPEKPVEPWRMKKGRFKGGFPRYR